MESRTGDTPARIRARQRDRLPSALVTTPESLSLLLTREDVPALFEHLQLVVVDEWHELMASKRGVQTELCLARLRRIRPGLQTLGLSATLGNLDTARDALLGMEDAGRARPGRIIQGLIPKALEVDALIPATMERFPWAGQIGLRLLPEVIRAIEEGETSLVFTNTRATAEIWFQALLAERPDWAGVIALHHGSMDRATREWVEDGLREGRLRCVVCTSTLDLGVDFTPVDRVLQVGSPKSVGRLIQRAGRSGHQPGAVSRLTCVPTNALELVDVAAARAALAAGAIEERRPVERPLDLLAQHAVTVALGGGFRSEELLPRGADHLGLPRSPRRRVALGARLHHPGRRCAPGLSGVRQGRGTGGPLRRHQPRSGDAPPAVDRHHRERVGDEGAVPPGPHHRHRRGELRRPAPPGRRVHLRRPGVAVRAGARHGGLRAALRRQEQHGAALVRRADADLATAGQAGFGPSSTRRARGCSPIRR